MATWSLFAAGGVVTARMRSVPASGLGAASVSAGAGRVPGAPPPGVAGAPGMAGSPETARPPGTAGLPGTAGAPETAGPPEAVRSPRGRTCSLDEDK